MKRILFGLPRVLLATLLCTRPATAQPPDQGDAGATVTVRAEPQKRIVRPGDQIAIAVVMDHAQGWHTWPAQDVLPPDIAEFAIRTKLEVAALPAWVDRVDGIQYPKPKPDKVANPNGGPPIEVPLYSHSAKGYIRIVVSPSAKLGDQDIEVKASWQACNDKVCQAPDEATVKVRVKIIAATDPAIAPPNEPELFSEFDDSQWGKSATTPTVGQVKPIQIVVPPFGTVTFDPSGLVGKALLLLAAAFGGLLLNFTPCVLPIIPIKILGLSKGAGNPRRCLLLGVIMCLGVTAFWLGIGLAMAFITGFKTISTLYQNPWFPLGVGVFMFSMGLGMLGLFTVRLPSAVYMINPKSETVPGSFVFGVLTAVLSTPCTAPFMGAAAAWAAFQAPAITISTFAAIGIGMALPYLILAANPKWVDKIPRTGPASELIKQIMGILMFGVAAFFIGLPVAGWLNTPPDPVSRAYWWLVGAAGGAAGMWLAYRTILITRSGGKRAAFAGGGVLFAVISVWFASLLSSHGPIKWKYFTPERFAEAKSRGETIVMDFTAEWCLNCKALESGVLHRKQIVKLLNDGDKIIPMRVDITGNNPVGKAKLKELNWVGIPLLAIFGPGVGYDDPIKMDSYTPEMVKQAIEKARGTAVARSSGAP